MDISNSALTKRLREYLHSEFPRDILMPVKGDTKMPVQSHKNGKWTWELYDAFAQKSPSFTSVGILLRELCVVDFDDVTTALRFEGEYPELRDAPMERTRKGRHYFFRRPHYADAEGFFDGARQVNKEEIDFKSVCSTGTSGLLVVSPSPGKEWERPLWSCDAKQISRELLTRVCQPRSNHSSSNSVVVAVVPPKSSSTRDPGELRVGRHKECYAAEDPVMRVLRALSPARWDERSSWIRIAMALKHDHGDTYRAAWMSLSRASSKYDASEARRQWDTLGQKGTNNDVDNDTNNDNNTMAIAFSPRPVTMRTVEMWARQDAAATLSSSRAMTPPATSSSSSSQLEVVNSSSPEQEDVSEALVDRVRRLLQSRFSDMDVVSGIVSTSFIKNKESISFDTPLGRGLINLPQLPMTWGRAVYVNSEFQGLLHDNVPVEGHFMEIHKAIPAAARSFIFNQNEQDLAVIKSVTPNIDAVISVHRPYDRNSSITVDVLGKNTLIRSKDVVELLKTKVHIALCKQDARCNLTAVFNINVNIHQHHQNKNDDTLGDAAARRHTDDELATMLLQEHTYIRDSLRCVPDAKTNNCNGLYLCDPLRKTWSQKPNVVIEEFLMELCRSCPGLTAQDLKHVESRRGRDDLRYCVASKVVDMDFLSKLDESLDLFAVSNGCFDMSNVDSSLSPHERFRPIGPRDYISKTAGYEFSAEEAAAHRADVERFLAQVFPVAEERRIILSYFASLLSGKRRVKKFLVLTDRRSGNNGKTTVLDLFRSTFGECYTAVDTKFVCRGSFDRDRDSHDAGTEPFQGKRLVVAEELKNTMKLDDAMLKRLTGGAHTVVTGRRCGSSARYSFTWQAGFVLIFNEGDCPQFDAGDTAFMERMLVAPMRSKFVAPRSRGESRGESRDHQQEHEELWTFEANYDIKDEFPKWRSALLTILLEHYTSPSVFSVLPPDMREWRTGLSADSNPLASWLDENVLQTNDCRDTIQLSREVKQACAHLTPYRTFNRYAKAYFVERSLDYRDKYDGQRNVILGCKWVVQDQALERWPS
jgi:phage/plasmid-associated DNA primase